MKTAPPPQPRQRGVTLVETLVSVGVLAVAAPLAIAALVRGGETATAARLENRAPALIERCLVEIAAAREARSELLPALTLGQPFGIDAPLCLAFRPDGSVLGKVDPTDYAAGLTDEARFLVRLQGHPAPARLGLPAMLRIDLRLEHPAAAPRERRRASNFHTLLP
jgi:type II secretory pathway pseudopilin PulG